MVTNKKKGNRPFEYKKYTTNYEERIVAFVDILGFSDMISRSENNVEIYEKINQALKTIQNVKKHSENTSAKITTFSDNIVISYPADGKDSLYYILIDLIHLQLELLQLGVLVRGGIAKGKVRHTKEMVFGPAMVAAYELESKYAVYPRIIVEKETVDWEKDNYRKQLYGASYDISDLDSLIERDKYNDIYYIDILKQRQELDYLEDYISLLYNLRNVIVDGLNSHKKEVRVKYIWLKNYFNDVVTNYPEKYMDLII